MSDDLPVARLRARRPIFPAAAWNDWYRRLLPAYWVFLFCATHFPRLSIDLGVSASDKILHMVCFGVLALCFWRFAETFRRPVSDRFVWLALAWLAAYAAVDEWLQQFVNRGTDLGDWLCDVAGVVAVLAWLEWRRRA